LFSNLSDAAGNHVIDLRRIKLVARDQAFERETQQIDWMPGFQHAIAPAQGRADCVNDHGLAGHAATLAF
jgi:hypothetical protein